MSTKKVSRSTSGPSYIGGPQAAVPAGITGTLRRMWDFASKTAQRFSKECKSPETKEQEFIKAVKRDASNW